MKRRGESAVVRRGGVECSGVEGGLRRAATRRV
jgi:hypothetical protein